MAEKPTPELPTPAAGTRHLKTFSYPYPRPYPYPKIYLCTVLVCLPSIQRSTQSSTQPSIQSSL